MVRAVRSEFDGIEEGRENLRAEHVEEYAVDGERFDAAS